MPALFDVVTKLLLANIEYLNSIQYDFKGEKETCSPYSLGRFVERGAIFGLKIKRVPAAGLFDVVTKLLLANT